jgi:PAS domain S-box-containing protein
LRGTFKAYAFSVGATAVAILLRWLLDPLLGDALPFVTVFGSVAAAAGLGGTRAGVLATVLGYIGVDFLFMEPRLSLAIARGSDVVGLAAYLFTCAIILAIGRAMRVAQEREAEQREQLRVTLRSIGDAVITTDNQARVTYLNEVAEDLTAWPLAEARGQSLESVFRIVNEHSRQAVESPATRALREGVVVGLANHTLLLRRDGREHPIDDSAAPIRDERGRVLGCVLTFRDVTQQRNAEREKSRQLIVARTLASIVETSDDAIVSKSLEGIITSWNEGAERIFGHRAAHAIGKHISLIIPPDRVAEENDIIARIRAGQRVDHFETERIRADGERIPVSLTISPIRDGSGTIVGASKIARDISERRRAEAEREKFVTLVESSTDFIGLCDLNGMPFYVNRAGLALVGLTSLEEARATPVREFFFPEDQGRIMDEFLPTVLAEGHGEVDIRFRHFRTGEARWMAYKVIMIRDAQGHPTAYATVSQDVTDRRRMEEHLRALAADLSEADRRKNEFLATLAHELRNPLAPISNAVQILRHRHELEPQDIEAASGLLERQVAQMSRLVDDLLDMSRITRGHIELRRERVDLGDVVMQAVEATRALYQSMNHDLKVVMPDEPIIVYADAARLAQVFGNLLNNACKFTDRGGHVSLTVEYRDGEAEIRVRDDGIGIAPSELPKVFEMFTQLDTSLERSRDGLGIGLTLVKTLVEMHGGSVRVHSEGVGRGSEFIVRLPSVEGTRLRSSAPAVSTPLRPRRILVVDDNEDGAESLSMLLEFSGHETSVAYDGIAALEAAERMKPDVILLDIGLPGLNGYQVARRIRQTSWGMDVALVAITGWGQDEDRHRSREAGFDAHMVKPVEPEELARILARMSRRNGASA